MQGTLETLDVAYAGPSVLAAAVAIDKLVCKRLLAFHGLPQVEFCEVGEDGWREQAAAMAKPLWVKPSRLGSSVGISRVPRPRASSTTRSSCARARPAGDRRGRRAGPRGRVLGDRQLGLGAGADTVETSLPGAIVTKASDWYDFEAKYDEGGMELVVPAPIGDAASPRSASSPRASSARSAAPGSPAATSSSANGEVLVNEINTIPGFTATSVFGKLFEATGVSYPDLCTGSSSSRSNATGASGPTGSDDGPPSAGPSGLTRPRA